MREVIRMKYFAIVKDRSTKEIRTLEMEYNSKKQFKSDISGNGYDLVGGFIYNEEQWNAMLNEEQWIIDMVEARRTKKRIKNRVKAQTRRERKKFDDRQMEILTQPDEDKKIVAVADGNKFWEYEFTSNYLEMVKTHKQSIKNMGAELLICKIKDKAYLQDLRDGYENYYTIKTSTIGQFITFKGKRVYI